MRIQVKGRGSATADDELLAIPDKSVDIALVATPPAGTFQKLGRPRLVQSLWMGVEKLLAEGKWIDDVHDPPGHPFPNPEEARDIYRQSGRKIHVDECRNASYYQHRVREFWQDHPGEKAKLAGQAARS